MSGYKLRNESVNAEDATDGARVRVFADEDREVLMERSDFEALFESQEDEAEEQAFDAPQVHDEGEGEA